MRISSSLQLGSLCHGLVLVVLSQALTGCLALRGDGLLPPDRMAAGAAPTSSLVEKCEGYDTSYTAWGAVAAGTGFLAGTGGVGTIALKDDKGKLAVGVVSLAVGTLSAISTFVATNKAKNFAEYQCPEVLHKSRQ